MAKYVLFDTETTGLGEEDRVIQVGAMVVSTDGSVVCYDELCQPKEDIEISLEAMEIHNITPEMLFGTKEYSETDFKQELDNLNTEENYLIAHNLPFDLKMIEKEGFECRMKQIDTLRCAKHLYPDEAHHRLQYLRYSLGLYKTEEEEAKKHNITIKAHDAIGDVLVMKLFLRDLVQKALKYAPTVNPMETLATLTQKPVLIKKFTFGKYKGELVEEVVKKDRGYLQWLRNNTDISNQDMVNTLDYYLD